MKRLIISLLLFACAAVSFAEKIEDRFVVRPVNDGLLYFISPFEITSTAKLPPAVADVTYILTRDTLTLNVSISLQEAIRADAIVFQSDSTVSIKNFETIYIDKKKGKFIHRYSCKLPYAYFKQMYESSASYQLEVIAKGRSYTYAYKAKQWPKEQDWMNQIIFLIEQNKIIIPDV